MAERAELESLGWLNIVTGLAVVAATLLSAGLEPSAYWFSLIEGLLLLGVAGYAAGAWERMSAGRRVGLSILAAAIAFALLAEWWSADFPVSLRRVMIALGLVGTLVGAFAAWKARPAA